MGVKDLGGSSSGDDERDSPRRISTDEAKSLIEKHTDITVDEALRRAEDKQDEIGWLNTKSALLLVLQDFGVDYNEKLGIERDTELEVAHTVPDMDNLNIDATVDSVDESANTFTRDDGSEGAVLNVELSDDSGQTQLALWDENVEVAKYLRPGDLVKIRGGYTSGSDYNEKYYDTRAEFQIGNSGRLIRVRNGDETTLIRDGEPA